MDFYHWLIEKKQLSQATASKYNLVIKNRISEWLPSYELPKNFIEFEALKELIVSLDIYQERNEVGNNMYSSALNHYGNYLKEYDQSHQTIFNDDESLTMEAERLVKIRLQQNKFRKGLFDLHPFCVVTGFSNQQLLIASHIKPWCLSNDLEKVDFYNGVLLTPNFDRLFDRGLISFQCNGGVMVSKMLTKKERDFLAIPETIKIEFSVKHHAYLKYHQEKIFKIS